VTVNVYIGSLLSYRQSVEGLGYYITIVLYHILYDDWVSNCRNFEVVGVKGRGRSRKTWGECIRQDLRSIGLNRESAQDRAEWRGLIGGNRPTRASMEKRT